MNKNNYRDWAVLGHQMSLFLIGDMEDICLTFARSLCYPLGM
jgi:hypothetical protein